MHKQIWILFLALKAFAATNNNGWWLQADAASLLEKEFNASKVIASRCSQIKPLWYISADNVYGNKQKLYLTKPKLNFLGAKLPLLYNSLPLDGSGQTGFLFPSISHNSNQGSKISLPFYLWGDKFHIGRLALDITSKLGTMFKAEQNIIMPTIGSIKTWLATASSGSAYSINADSKNWHLAWSDTDNPDLYWLWGLKRLPVLQARLERQLSFQSSAPWGNLDFEIFKPKILRGKYDQGLESDYGWEPRAQWSYAQNINQGTLKQTVQWTSFNLEQPLPLDTRPKHVNRALISSELDSNLIFTDSYKLNTQLGVHAVKSIWHDGRAQAVVPWGILRLEKTTATYTSQMLFRYAPFVAQDKLPILDLEPAQANINTWLSGKYFVGDDRVSDIKSLGFSTTTNLNGWRALIGFRHDSKSKVCLSNSCAQPDKNLLAMGLDSNQGLSSFVIYNGSDIEYLSEEYTTTAKNFGKFTLGLHKTPNMDKQIYFGYDAKLYKNLNFAASYESQLAKNQPHTRSHFAIYKHSKCLNISLNFTREKLASIADSRLSLSLTIV